MCEWQRKGWDLDSIIDKTLEWHISSFNPKSIPIPYDWKDKCEYWISKMGYHFALKSAVYPESAGAGDLIVLNLTVENVGSAPCYKELPLVLRVSGGGRNEDFTQSCDVRKWLPGVHTESLRATLPGDLPRGEYDIEIGLISPHADIVYLATNAERRGGFYKIGSIVVK